MSMNFKVQVGQNLEYTSPSNPLSRLLGEFTIDDNSYYPKDFNIENYDVEEFSALSEFLDLSAKVSVLVRDDIKTLIDTLIIEFFILKYDYKQTIEVILQLTEISCLLHLLAYANVGNSDGIVIITRLD